jgi:hypothetical protein
MRLAGGGLLALVLTAGALAGCGDEPAIEPAAEPRFDSQQVAWAHQRTLHYGEQQFTLPRRIRGLAVADYGFFLELSDENSFEGPTTWGFFDGETWLPLGGDPTGPVTVSADGRYAGWVDQDGPRRPAGRIREIVVADVAKGEAVLKDHSGMGGSLGDDLGDRYEELAPTFLGFDEGSEHAYWTDASGAGTRKRADLSTGEVEEAPVEIPEDAPMAEGDEGPVSNVVDAYRGRRAGPVGASGPVDLQYGLYSPDERFAVDISAPGRTLVFDADTGKRIRVDFPLPAQYFGGWLPDGAFYVIGTAQRIEGYDPNVPDPTSGQVVVCHLPAGDCEVGAAVPGMRDVVVPGAQSLLG